MSEIHELCRHERSLYTDELTHSCVCVNMSNVFDGDPAHYRDLAHFRNADI